MIFSASRRTDIPTWYAEWLCNRLASGSVCVRHNVRVTRWRFTRESVDCLALWTKNPLPLLEPKRTAFLREWPCAFQFTLTGYGADVEPGLPDKRLLLEAFAALADVFGADRMVWRYDPVFFGDAYPSSRHAALFKALAKRLQGHTRTCVISFLDAYPKLRRRLSPLGVRESGADERRTLVARLAETAARCGMSLRLCAEALDVPGVGHGGCLDRAFVEGAAGCRLDVRPSRQRTLCRCAASLDIGVYGSCGNGCLYCYANGDGTPVGRGSPFHDPASPLLVGRLAPEDEVTERRCVSLKSRQLSLW